METSWTVYQNLITCLTKYRGLEVEEVLEKEDFVRTMQYEQVIKIIAGNTIVILVGYDSPKVKKLPDFRKLLSKFAPELEEDNKDLEVLIITDTQLKINPKNEMEKYPIHFKNYTYSFFKMELPTHIYFGEHNLMTEDEVIIIEKQLSTNRKNFPKINHENDGGAIWVGAKPGQCVRIKNLIETSGEIIGYRYVI